MKAVRAKCKIWQKRTDKNSQFQLFIYYKPACLQENIHGRVLSIRMFFSDRHYGLIVSLRGRTLSRQVINSPIPIYYSNLAPRLRGIKPKKLIIHPSFPMRFLLFYPIHTEIFAPKINEINFIPGRTVFVTSEKYRPTNHRPRTALCH